MRTLRIVTAILCLVLASPGAIGQQAGRFRSRFYYDKDNETLGITKLRFFNATQGLAIGSIADKNQRLRGVLVTTSDGGENWRVEPFAQIPLSLFVLDDSYAWIVAEKNLFRTEERGRAWTKLPLPKNVVSVHFLDAQRGFAAGANRTFLRTEDGGRSWKPVPEAEQLTTSKDSTALSTFAFALNGKLGILAGHRVAQRRESRFPTWLDPESSQRRYQRPEVMVVLQTVDGGKTWRADTAAAFGRVAALALDDAGVGLLTVRFDEEFEFPGEVYTVSFATGATERVFRMTTEQPTDAVFLKGTAFLASIEEQAKVRGLGIPGKVKIRMAKGPKFNLWQSIPVDYRASATYVSLATDPGGNVWAATNSGMILRLEIPK